MRPTSELLFTPLPRFVGNPSQWLVYDEPSFEYFREANDGSANCYSRISWLKPNGEWALDRVFLDLDSEKKLEITDSEMVTSLRANDGFAAELLDDVVADVRAIAELLYEESIPAVGVYTGKGVHIHALYEARENPVEELKSQTDWILDQVGVQTFDRQVYGDTKRLCRVPNCRRYDDRLEKPTDLFQVPLERREMRDLTARELVEWSKSVRTIELPGESRPPLLTHPDYQPEERAAQSVAVEPAEVAEYDPSAVEESVEDWLRDVLKLPCIAERILTRNPDHPIRLAAAISLLNAGLTVDEIVNVFRALGWADFDPKVTRKHVRQIKAEGYSSLSCATLQTEGMCLWSVDEREDECEHYGYPGGVLEY